MFISIINTIKNSNIKIAISISLIIKINLTIRISLVIKTIIMVTRSINTTIKIKIDTQTSTIFFRHNSDCKLQLILIRQQLLTRC